MILKISGGSMARLPPKVVGLPTINNISCKLQKLVPMLKLCHIYARPATREVQRVLASCKIFRPPGKMCWTLLGYSFKKFGPLSENSSSSLVSQAGCRPGQCKWKTFKNCFRCINVQWDVVTQSTWKNLNFAFLLARAYGVVCWWQSTLKL